MVEKLPDNNRFLKILTVIISILLIGTSVLLFDNIQKLKLQDITIGELNNLSENQKERITRLESSIADLRQNLSMKDEQLRNETVASQKLQQEIINLTMVAKSDYGVVAVDQNEIGHVIPVEVVLKNGNGSLFINVANVLFDPTLQFSAQTAVRVAREVTRTSLSNKDVLINIEAPVEAPGLEIAGGSAGSAMTLAVIAAMEGKKLRNDVYITGTINEDHSIGKIGAARAKALAAKQNGAVMFLVPLGQASDVGYIGIEIREVGTIEEAARYAISS